MPHRVLPAELTRASSATSTTSDSSTSTSSCDASVIQALEIARESPDGAQDPTVSKILEGAISSIWGKVEAAPQSYVMTREEFSVFNYFQHRFMENSTARMARARYWDHASA